ncbi:MAG: hypothetical protein AAFY31_17585 [Pseudomonadota bacterium]
MNRELEQLKGLADIAGLAYRAAQADMARITQKEADLRRNLAQLTESKASLARTPRPSDDAAMIAGADIRWHRWVDQRRAAINAELAQVRASKDYYQSKLRLAFGKDQVASALLDSAVLGARRESSRRSNYES